MRYCELTGSVDGGLRLCVPTATIGPDNVADVVRELRETADLLEETGVPKVRCPKTGEYGRACGDCHRECGARDYRTSGDGCWFIHRDDDEAIFCPLSRDPVTDSACRDCEERDCLARHENTRCLRPWGDFRVCDDCTRAQYNDCFPEEGER